MHFDFISLKRKYYEIEQFIFLKKHAFEWYFDSTKYKTLVNAKITVNINDIPDVQLNELLVLRLIFLLFLIKMIQLFYK